MTQHHSMSNREAATKVRPKNRSDRRLLMFLGASVISIVVFVATDIFLIHRHRQDIETNWQSSTATIEDVRFQPAIQVESNRGGAMLYDVQVLAQYSLDGTVQKKWITVQQPPRGIAEAKLEAFRWKGQTCFVRWKPNSPDQVIADVS